MSKAPKPGVSALSEAISTEVKVLMARNDTDAKSLAAASQIKAGRLGYLLRRERSWNVVEVNAVAQVFGLQASEIVAQAEANMPVRRLTQADVAPAAENRPGEDEADYEGA